jgi:hypothetical protein
VVLTDFDERAALQIYPHTPSSLSVLGQSFDALHRLGVGVDSMNLARAAHAANLERYSLIVIAAAQRLMAPRYLTPLSSTWRKEALH